MSNLEGKDYDLLLKKYQTKMYDVLQTLLEEAMAKKEFPEINLETDPVGIFGKHTTLDHILREKDRVEIYRPLIADPKEIRRQRAEQGKKMKKGGDNDG